MRDLGTPALSRKLIENIIAEFPERSKIFIARHNGKPIGGKFVMFFKDRVYFIWASSLKRYFKMAPASLLNWEAIKYSCHRGIRFCDFGRSTVDDGAYRFKKQFGGETKQLYWQYYLNNGHKLPELSTTSPKYKLASEVWKRLPVAVTNFIGPKVMKYVP